MACIPWSTCSAVRPRTVGWLKHRTYAVPQDEQGMKMGAAAPLESSQQELQPPPRVDVLDPYEVLNMFEDDSRDDFGEDQETLPAARAGEEREFLLKVLDACIDTTDMKLVAKTYAFLRKKGLIQNFGRYKSLEFDVSDRLITPAALKEMAGLEASKLSPKKWGISGASGGILVFAIALQAFLQSNGFETRPVLLFLIALSLLDTTYLGGAGLAQVQSFWLPYKRRIMVHEAGHVLVAYLLGCPVRGVVLDVFQAMKLGIQGQAGTQFWDAALEEELVLGRLTAATFDRYTMVLFAGIAAEALVYGEAEGGENDEKLYVSVIEGLSPPWSTAKTGNQARWAVLQSFQLLKKHRLVHKAVTKALDDGAALSTVVKNIEDAMALEADNS